MIGRETREPTSTSDLEGSNVAVVNGGDDDDDEEID